MLTITGRHKIPGSAAGSSTAALPVPLSCTLPGKLYVRSYVHGEVKLTPSLVAGTDAGARGARARERRRGYVPVAAHDVVSGFLDSWLRREGQWSDTYGATLDSCSEFQDASKVYPGYGQVCRDSKFSAYSRIRVQEAGEVQKRRYGRNGRMITLTCPGSGDEIAKTFSMWCGYMVARYRQWLRDVLKCEHSVVGVWEWQKRGMLHLHLAVMCNDEGALLRLDERFKVAWARILKCVMSKSGVDLCATSERYSWLPEGPVSQQDCQPIRQDVARYLSKYLSKDKMRMANTALYCPSRWVTVDRETAREARMLRTYAVLEGFSLATWQDVVDVIEDECQEVMTNGRRYEHPFFAGVRGAVVWCEPDLVPRFLECIDDCILLAQAMGAQITNTGSTRGIDNESIG